MEAQYFVGLDLASATLTAAVVRQPLELYLAPQEFANDPEGFAALLGWLEQHGVRPDRTWCCMEATGVYGEALAYYLVAHDWWVAVEPPLAVKRAFAPVGHKNDAVDSRQIAEYAARFTDQLRRWQPRPQLLEHIKVLLGTRAQLTKQKTAHQNALRALQRKVVRTRLAEQLHQQSLKQLQQQVRVIDQELERLLGQDPRLGQTAGLLTTIPGVGLLLATHLLVVFATLQEPTNPRTLAAYLGVSPYERRSGASLHRRARSRHYGPAPVRRLLYLASMSVRTHHPEFQRYFLRKTLQGKPAKLVLNNIANKLLKIACAVVRDQRPFIPEYRSVPPHLL